MILNSILFDTSVIIDHLRSYQPSTEFLEIVVNCGTQAMVSTITEMELFAGKSMQNPTVLEKTENVLELFMVLPVTSEIARHAGVLLREYRHQGLTPSDALIASTALLYGASLITRNIKHFRMIKNILAFDIPVD